MKLSRAQLAWLGLALTAAEVLQRLLIHATANVHTVIAIVILTLGSLGATTAAASYIGTVMSHQTAIVLTLVGQALQAGNTAISTSSPWHAVLGGALVLFMTIGIKTDVPLPLTQAATREARQLAPKASS